MSYPPIAIRNNSTNTQGTRRKSLLDFGGVNSINNFASSYTRAQSYAGLSYLESAIDDDISPNTSPELTAAGNEENIEPIRDIGRGYNHFETFGFNPTEETALIDRSTETENLPKGLSTAPQTVFNSINTLIGVGLFSLPFGFRLSGWIIGTFILVASSFITGYTAKLLGRILKKHPELKSYGEIAQKYGGNTVQGLVTLVFTLDITGAILSMILLFSDSFSSLLPNVAPQVFKAVVVVIVCLLSFLPLSILSIFSLIGIICTTFILVLTVVCGSLSTISPGSLLIPTETFLFPKNYKNLLLSLGIFFAPWGGHPVFPELYKDMRHPRKYNTCVNTAFFITFDLDFMIAIVGYLMYGNLCDDSITKTLMKNDTYPDWVTPTLCVALGMLSISKIPLLFKPIITVYEGYFNLSNHVNLEGGKLVETYEYKKILARILFSCCLLTLSLIFTSFGRVISFLGSAICFNICMTLPLLFSMKLLKDELTPFQSLCIKIGAFIGIVCAILGTYGSIAINPS